MKVHRNLPGLIISLLLLVFINPGLASGEKLTAASTTYLPLVYREFSFIPRQIAFLGLDAPTNKWDLYLMNEDGGQLQNLTNQPSRISFTWSPDGAKFTFSTNWDGNYEIYTMNADGSDLLRITHNTAYDGSPSWSNDSAHIAFASNRDGSWEIYSMDSNGNNVSRLTDMAVDCDYPVWSPNGSKIAFITRGASYNDSEIYVMNPDGSGQIRLTENSYYDRLKEWSPDSSKLLFLSNRDHGGEMDNSDVYTMDANGMDVARLTTSGYIQATTWSPQGSKIAYSDFSGFNGLFIMNPDGAEKTQILCQIDPIETYDPSWSFDGTKIAYSPYSGIIGDTTGIYVAKIDGTNCLHLTTMLASEPEWRPGD